eukprot:12250291-Karenia_brevis.AAC.1
MRTGHSKDSFSKERKGEHTKGKVSKERTKTITTHTTAVCARKKSEEMMEKAAQFAEGYATGNAR